MKQLPAPSTDLRDYLPAIEPARLTPGHLGLELTTLIAVGQLAVAFAIGFLMPKQARESVGSPTEPALA